MRPCCNSVGLTCKHEQHQQQPRAEGGQARPAGEGVLVDRGEGAVTLHDGHQDRVRHQVLGRYTLYYIYIIYNI